MVVVVVLGVGTVVVVGSDVVDQDLVVVVGPHPIGGSGQCPFHQSCWSIQKHARNGKFLSSKKVSFRDSRFLWI